MRRSAKLCLLLPFFFATALVAAVAPDSPVFPGLQADGSILLPNQWSLRPAGKQVPMGDFPVNVALHPGGRWAAVLHCGFGQHEVITVDLNTSRVVGRANLDEAFYGIAFTADGNTLYCSGAGLEVVHVFDFRDGYLSNHATIKLRAPKQKGVVAGIAVSADGKQLYAANLWGHSITSVDLTTKTVEADIALGSAPALPDAPVETPRAGVPPIFKGSSPPFPYACVLDEPRERLYVSLWGQAAVAVIDLKSRTVAARWVTEEHPNEMLLNRAGTLLFVANANRNTVSVIETETGETSETLDAALSPDAPAGATPNSLALSPDEKTLFIANANLNCVTVFDVSTPGHSRSLGFIPAGWYPTSVRVASDGKRLVIANGKGISPRANRHGPQPSENVPETMREYIGGLLRGTLSVITLPDAKEFAGQLTKYTAATFACKPVAADKTAAARPADHPVPAKVGDPSPIQYCVYIIKENRTYDQIFGDIREGNGDPTLCLFGQEVTPNHHQLAREFVLFDNFYVDGEVSADGHEWTMGAYATDFVEKSWPMSYGHDGLNKYPYPSEGNLPIAAPVAGYLFDRAKEAGITYHSYGEFVQNGAKGKPCTTRMAALEGHFDPEYRSFDLAYSDAKRADRFLVELKRFEEDNSLPRLCIVRLPNDHTQGTAKGALTPRAMVADNDAALGRVVEALSHSKFWPQMAIFVIEDDAQNGPDHVDAHRSIALVISPYTRRAAVDSSLYSTTSMLRTMELILGLKPLSQFDAVAVPMYAAFQPKPDTRPYAALPSRIDTGEKNKDTAWGAKESDEMDFTREDAADDIRLNEIVWRSVRGADSPMPAPRRAAFVRTRAVLGDHDEDD